MRPRHTAVIKTGQKVKVRRVGNERWVPATVEVASANQKSLAVSAVEGLGSPGGFSFNRETGRMMLLLAWRGPGQPYYQDIVTNSEWEVEDAQDQ